MLKRISCYVTGGHQAEVSREGGTMFLLCERCGWRSAGIELRDAQESGRSGSSAARRDLRLPLFNRTVKQ